MKILVVLMLLAPLGLTQDVLFEDDFDDGNADGWFEYVSGATYQVNGDYRYELSGSDSVFAFSHCGDNGSTMSEMNYSVLVEVIGHSPTKQSGISVRYMHAAGTCYSVYISYYYGTYYIIRYDSFLASTMLGASVSFPGGFDYITPYWVRFECYNSTLRAKVWTGTAGDEPAYWMIQRNDGTYIDYGCMALESGTSSSPNHRSEFDNVVVTGFMITLENSTWGAIKSAF